MYELLIKVLALGIASAASPVILALAVSILTGKEHPEKKLIYLLLGGILCALILIFAGNILWSDSTRVPEYAESFDLVIGSIMIIFGVTQLIPKKDEKIKRKGINSSFGLIALGFLINITNFDAVLLNLTAIREILSADIGIISEFILTFIADFFFLSPCLVPLLVYMVYPNKTKKVLEPVGKFLEKYGKWIVSAIFIGFGIYLIFLN